MLHGKTLYSQIFYNHIMGMAYFSFVIQKLHHGINLYDLVLVHRQAIMLFAFIFDVLLIKRFKWAGAWFVLFFEMSKFYVFGDRFLGEAIVVYPVVYILGLVYAKLRKEQISFSDLLFAGILSFLIIFTREPYIPLALSLYVILLWGKFQKTKIVSIAVFLGLIFLVLINTSLKDLYFNDVTVNLATILKGETNTHQLLGLGSINIFLYPVTIFISGKWNAFRLFLIGLDVSFLLGLSYQVFIQKNRKVFVIMLFLLGLANIRFVLPGTTYFEAYHMLVWFGMFLFLSIFLTLNVLKRYKKFGLFLFSLILLGWGIAVFAPGSYLYNKINLQEKLLTNFGNEMNVGYVVKNLSDPKDTLFLDGADDMIYWVANRHSPYKYSWYTSVMPKIPLYTQARLSMFHENPPDFYYDFCSPLAPYHSSLPPFIQDSYLQLYSNGNPSCLYVLKRKLTGITSQQWDKARQGFYSLPDLKSF